MSIAVEIINQNEWPPTFLKSGKGPLYTCIIASITHIQKIDLGVRPSCTHVNQTVI